MLDSAGNPRIGYTLGADMRYAWRDGAGWHSETVDPSGGDPISMALDSAGNPGISYRDATTGALKYALASPTQPAADFTESLATGTGSLAVQFTDASTYSPTAWSWEFGDGATSTEQDPLHEYASPGTYTVRLTAVINGVGYTRTKLITVVPGAGYIFERAWGSYGTGDGQFYNPEGVTTDGAGNVFVSDTGNKRVQRFAASGTHQSTWGARSYEGEFESPSGIAVDGAGNVYVADTNNHRVQKFDSDGTFVTMWGGDGPGYDGLGSGDGQFCRPNGITVDGAGNVYVADTGNHRVQKFDVNGAFLAKWGTEGSGDGQFKNPSGIAVDGAGNVYVVDRDNARVQKFGASGAFLATWGSYGEGDGQFRYPSGIAVDGAGNVYVVDANNYRVQKFDANGAFLAKWGSYGSEDGQFSTPSGIAVDGAGTVYVADTGKSLVHTFDANGTFLAKWGVFGEGDGQFSSLSGIAVDGAGNVYVTDGEYWSNYRVQKFTSDGTFLVNWGSSGSGDGTFPPYGIAVDGAGNVYVTDRENGRVQKFTSDGTFLTRWGTMGSGDGELSYPEGIAVDCAGNVYVVDSDNHRVVKFDANGTFLEKWGGDGPIYGGGSDDGQFYYPEGIAVDGAGNVYVADGSYNSRVQKFDADGTFLAKWGSSGSGDGEFSSPSGIAVDGAGNVYVTDRMNNRVQKFTSDGTFLTKWGSYGSSSGQFQYPSGIAVDGAGNVYVVDTGNNRVQKFAPVTTEPPKPPVAAFTANVSSGPAPLTVLFTDRSTNSPTGWAWEFGDGATATERNPTHVYLAPGTYTVNLTASNDHGSSTASRSITVTTAQPSVLPVSPSTSPPKDTNADGKYDDVNGNGRADFADVVLYFNQMTWIADHEPVGLFDYNGNGRIDFADVVWLFNHL